MKSALFGALMLSSQLIRAQAEEKRWAVCRMMPSDEDMSEPIIDGTLLIHEGVNDGSAVIKGVLNDFNQTPDNLIERRRFNAMEVFSNYHPRCDIDAMQPNYERIEKPLKFKNDHYSIYFNDDNSFSLFDDSEIVDQGSIGIFDEVEHKVVACCKVESIEKAAYDDLMLEYKAEKSMVRAERIKEREERDANQ